MKVLVGTFNKEQVLARALSGTVKFRKGLLTALMRDRDGVHPEGGALRQDADEDGGPSLPSPTPTPDILQVPELKPIFGSHLFL